MVTTLEGRALSRPKHKRKGTLEGGRSSFKVWDDTAVVPPSLLRRFRLLSKTPAPMGDAQLRYILRVERDVGMAAHRRYQ